MRFGNFLFPDVAAGLVAREAARGVFHGGDVVFGPQTGAIGVRNLDRRITATAVAGARAAAQDLASSAAKAG